MANTTNTVSEAPAMICPVCGKQFFDIISFADHLTSHSNEEKKRKVEEEKKAKEIKRNADLDNLMTIYNEYTNSKKKLDNALKEYESNYGGYIIPYNHPFQSILDVLFN